MPQIPPKTHTSTVFIVGIPIEIDWTWHGENKIQWVMNCQKTDPAHAMNLLENFLRAMRNNYIEYMLNEEHQAKTYEADQRASMAAENYNPF